MFIEEELDSGPILLQRETLIGDNETAPELMQRLAITGAELLSDTLTRLNLLTPRPQRSRDATFAPLLQKTDGAINWSNSAATIERSVRGFQPWPNAYTYHESQRLIIWRAATVDMPRSDAREGEMIATHDDNLVVKCGDDTALRILEIQPEARRRMSARDYLNGAHLKIGDRLGEV
jgi:methionyl-tRNA formyltransferase